MLLNSLPILAIAATVFARRTTLERRGPVPEGIVDPGAHPGCTLWHDNVNGNPECQFLVVFYNITPEQLLGWVCDSARASRESGF
jgi:hypothetical protein